MRVRAKPAAERSEAHPQWSREGQAVVAHLAAYLTGSLNQEAGEALLRALKVARARGHVALDSALRAIFEHYAEGKQ